jgi:hypothetical protein
MSFRQITLLLFLLTICPLAMGQSAPTNASPVSASIDQLQKQYAQSFPVHSQLFNGPEYVDYAKRYQKNIGHQFFLSPEQAQGSVFYNDHYFPGLPLVYDIVLEQIILQQPGSPLRLRLVNEKVRSFSLADHHFIRVEADSATGDVIRTGFYEVLVDSTVQVLAKRSKQQKERINEGKTRLEFTPADKLFLKKAGTYYSINSRGALTRLLADRGKEVQQYIRANKLKFRKGTREADIVQLTRYYNGLASQ